MSSEPVGDRAQLFAFLQRAGASEADIERATAEGWLPILTLDRVLMPGAPVYDLAGVAAAAGTDLHTVHRIWRAVGFPDVPEGLALFTDIDVEALRRVLARDEDEILRATGPNEEQQVRVVSAALARIATFEAELLAGVVEYLRDAELDDADVALALYERLDFDDLAWLIDYAHRLQLRAAVWRRMTRGGTGNTVELAVGFADLSGYTELAEELDDEQLATLLDHFDDLVYDTVARHGGRIVKTIGDEVMYVGTPLAVAAIALDVLERAQAIQTLPSLRQGIAHGSLLSREGDYFGPVVNLASRLTDMARPGTILASPALRDALADASGFTFRALRSRRIRGIGPVVPYVLRPGPTEADAPPR